MAGNISSAKIFAHDFSRAFCSLDVRLKKLSTMDICWQEFYLNDICNTSFINYLHYTIKKPTMLVFTTKDYAFKE